MNNVSSANQVAVIEQVLNQLAAMQKTLESWQRELQQQEQVLRNHLALAKEVLTPTPPSAPTPPVKPAAAVFVAPASKRPALSIGSGPERRLAPRRRGNVVQVTITDAAGTLEPFPGWIVDRSTGGVGLLVDEALAPGTVLNIQPTHVEGETGWVQIVVKTCRPHQNSWNLGCQFQNKLTWNELQWFG